VSFWEDRYDVRAGVNYDGNMCISIYCQPRPGVWSVAKAIVLEFHELKEMEEHPPTMRLNHIEGDLLIRAFARACGAHPDEKDMKLAAQKVVIETLQDQIDDLRELLKLEKPRPRRRIEI
jgi:hypothetical protein